MKVKFNSKTKVIFVTFAVMVAAMVGFFAYAMSRDYLIEEEHIELRQGAIIYDQNSLPMETSEPGLITLKWTGDYYYASESKAVKVNLGKHTIASDGDSIYVIGGGYKISTDASALSLPNFYETNLKENQFFKLADRKYLLVSEEIKDDGELVDAKNYLYILIDKQGNAQLVNNEVNGKTQVPSILNSEEYIFDIANELLNVRQTFAVDMKDVIGTTNEFDPQTYINANTGETNLNPEELDIEVNGGDGGTGGTGGEGGIGGVGGTGGTGGRGSNSEQADIVKEIMLLGVERGTTTLTVKYHATDPFAQYGLIYLALYDGNINVNDATNKRKYVENSLSGVNTYANTWTFKNLTPGTTYQIVIGHITDADDDEWYVDDVIKTSTYQITNSLVVKQQTATNVYLNIKLDEYYDNYQFARVAFFYNSLGDAGTDKLYPIDLQAATSANGIQLVIPYDKDNASTHELFTYEVQLSNRAAFVDDQNPPQADYVVAAKSLSVNGYYENSTGNDYTVTFTNGITDTAIKQIVVTKDANGKFYMTVPAALDPLKLNLPDSGWGLIFNGWKFDDNNDIYAENQQIELIGESRTVKAKAVWSCVLNATFSSVEAKCICDTGYEKSNEGDIQACKIIGSGTSSTNGGD